MNVETELSNDKMTLTIGINGDFNFTLLREFRNAYNNSEGAAAKNIIIDLQNTSTMDSAALGMLLAMHSHLKLDNDAISIINQNEVIGKVLEITHFEKKFKI